MHLCFTRNTLSQKPTFSGASTSDPMKNIVLASLCFFFTLCFTRAQTEPPPDLQRALLPPRGWNSFDSFIWTLNETDFLKTAQLVCDRLKNFGYEFVVLDYLWYRKDVEGSGTLAKGFDIIDEWGRMVPDPVRWPSSAGGNGFTEVARKVHDMGLKFGIHIMRGLSVQAFEANTPILDISTGAAYQEGGRQWRAKDIGIKERVCPWMKDGFMAINATSGAGKAFLRSLHQQYFEWGLDFLKHDCVFGEDYDFDEISYVSDLIKSYNRSIVYSLSPGTSVTTALASNITSKCNMYRVSADDWDKWGDVLAHFNLSRDFAAANMLGIEGLMGKSWPDQDMLPMGFIASPDTNNGPYRRTNLTIDEQKTQMTLWCMAKSPLMFGGDMRVLDNTTFSIITNPTLLEIDHYSSLNQEIPYGKRIHGENGEKQTNTKFMGLTHCSDAKARRWYINKIKGGEQVCWNQSAEVPKNDAQLCLYKQKPDLESEDDKKAYEQKYKGTVHLSPSRSGDLCLGASSRRKLTSMEFHRGSLAPCSLDTNQMWKIENGTLVNMYSNLCALMLDGEEPQGQAISNSGEIKVWTALGRFGEIFVAFFNLDQVEATISLTMEDLAKVYPTRNLVKAKCVSQEAWSDTHLSRIDAAVTAKVSPHGTALFVLHC